MRLRLLVVLVSLSTNFFFIVSFLLMAPRRETIASRAQDKRPTEPSQLAQTKASQKIRFDTTLFSLVEDYQRYKQKFAQRKVVPERSIDFSQLQHFRFEGLFGRMGWLPIVTISKLIFFTLVRTFYLRVTYGLGGPIISTVRGVEIQLDLESICHILDIPSFGLKVYESKTWPTVLINRVLHHMICSSLLPQGEHRDEVSYIEAFLVDSILTGRWIHMGYLMMMHMISCCESTTRVLPYERFLTRVFKDAGVDLSKETNFKAPSIYDTYDE